MRFLLSAGEASGDTYGAQLIEALGRLAPQAQFFGMGGEKMRAAGCELLVSAKEVAVVGLAEVLTHLPHIRKQFHRMVQEAAQRRPDAAILIDFPDFNLRLTRRLHGLGIPVFYFVSPQLWAWRSGRVKQIKKYVRKMIVIFPFEQDFYRRHGVEVAYVGHPLAHVSPPGVSREELAARAGLNAAKPWIALLPGSRRKEVLLNLPEMLRAAHILAERGFAGEFVLPVASTLDENWLRSQLQDASLLVHLAQDARAALPHCRAAVVASGTATVEAALAGTPFVAVYRVAPLTWLLGRRFVNLDTFAMPNLIAGRRIVPELIQGDFTAANVIRELNLIFLDESAREQMRRDLAEVREKLRESGSVEAPAVRAAREILNGLG